MSSKNSHISMGSSSINKHMSNYNPINIKQPQHASSGTNYESVTPNPQYDESLIHNRKA